jgi:iron-sulfur cluster assembly protein
MSPTVALSDAAAAKFRDLTAAETASVGLRVYVTSGGCSGYRYGMMIEDAPRPDDARLQLGGIEVYLDPQTAPLIDGATIDYVDSLMGAGFTVDNPNAVAACGCGSSFRTADGGGSPGACGR